MSLVWPRLLFMGVAIAVSLAVSLSLASLEPFALSASLNIAFGVVAALLWWRFYPDDEQVAFVPTPASERPALIGFFIVPLIFLAALLMMFAFAQGDSGALFIGASLLTCYWLWARNVALDRD